MPDLAVGVISFRLIMEARRVLTCARHHLFTQCSEVNLTCLVMAKQFLGQSASQVSILLAIPWSKARTLPKLGGELMILNLITSVLEDRIVFLKQGIGARALWPWLVRRLGGMVHRLVKIQGPNDITEARSLVQGLQLHRAAVITTLLPHQPPLWACMNLSSIMDDSIIQGGPTGPVWGVS